MSNKNKRHSYESEAQAKGGSLPPDLKRNSKSRSFDTQLEHMGGHDKQEQKELQRERLQETEFERTREDTF
jgi:hypothetical protein